MCLCVCTCGVCVYERETETQTETGTETERTDDHRGQKRVLNLPGTVAAGSYEPQVLALWQNKCS